MKKQTEKSSAIYEDEGESLSIARCQKEDDESIEGGHRENNSTDPMNIYLREMGSLDLLSYEEEIQLAQKLEQGEARIQSAVLRLTMGLNTLNGLKKGLERGNMRIGSVLNGISDSDEKELAAVRVSFLECIEKANLLNQQRVELFQALKDKDKKGQEENLWQEIKAIGLQIVALFTPYRISSKKLLKTAKAVEEFNEKVRKIRLQAEREALLATHKARPEDKPQQVMHDEEQVYLDLAETVGFYARFAF